jgi:CheY-like chemotaxis protein
LAFSRGQPLAPKVLDLGSLVTDMEDLLRRLVGPAVAVEIDVGRAPSWILADPVQMGQVVLNLVINARDAISGTGDVIVDVSPMTVSADHAVGDAPPGTYVALRVRDNGCGMTDEVRRRIFEPFYTTKPVGEGTGLGLATVYGIVHQSGGAIGVDTAPGGGTTFTVVLPAASAPTEPEPDIGEGGGRGRTVLVVDDEHGVRALARHALESAGYTVLTASDGEEGLRSTEGSAVPIDCVITDLLMPTMNGVEMVQQLRRARPELPVLYISGYFDGGSPLEATLPPGTAVLNKPFTAVELLRAVDALTPGSTRTARSHSGR